MIQYPLIYSYYAWNFSVQHSRITQIYRESIYLISQYADDSTIILEDDETSLNVTLELLYYFSDCSGLRANFDKTEAIWIGAKRGCVETIKTIKNIRWNFDGKFKVLGI